VAATAFAVAGRNHLLVATSAALRSVAGFFLSRFKRFPVMEKLLPQFDEMSAEIGARVLLSRKEVLSILGKFPAQFIPIFIRGAT